MQAHSQQLHIAKYHACGCAPTRDDWHASTLWKPTAASAPGRGSHDQYSTLQRAQYLTALCSQGNQEAGAEQVRGTLVVCMVLADSMLSISIHSPVSCALAQNTSVCVQGPSKLILQTLGAFAAVSLATAPFTGG